MRQSSGAPTGGSTLSPSGMHGGSDVARANAASGPTNLCALNSRAGAGCLLRPPHPRPPAQTARVDTGRSAQTALPLSVGVNPPRYTSRPPGDCRSRRAISASIDRVMALQALSSPGADVGAKRCFLRQEFSRETTVLLFDVKQFEQVLKLQRVVFFARQWP